MYGPQQLLVPVPHRGQHFRRIHPGPALPHRLQHLRDCGARDGALGAANISGHRGGHRRRRRAELARGAEGLRKVAQRSPEPLVDGPLDLGGVDDGRQAVADLPDRNQHLRLHLRVLANPPALPLRCLLCECRTCCGRGGIRCCCRRGARRLLPQPPHLLQHRLRHLRQGVPLFPDRLNDLPEVDVHSVLPNGRQNRRWIATGPHALHLRGDHGHILSRLVS
mmetsp:Transcript_120517/g.300634  ORF Transcript_120517/g.300634 Transcript_120517/m.300634 type:complete len:222 (+) Transcript_120517:481-1146(+)